MNPIQFVALTLATGAVFFSPGVSAQDSRPAPPAPAEVHESPMQGLESLRGVVVLGSLDHFSRSGVTNDLDHKVMVDGPDFLKQHASQVKAVLQPYLGQPLSQGQLKRLQRDLILLCRKLDRPWVDAYYPPQEIKNHVAQIMVYEGRLGKVSAVYWPFNHPSKKWFSERFITNSIHLKPGDSISQKKLMADLDHINTMSPLFLEANVDVKQGRFKQDGTASTDIDVLVKDQFPLRVFTAYDDYGVKTLGENRLSAGLNYGNLWGLAHQFNYMYTTDWDFDHLRSHNASYVAPFSWGDTLTVFGGYSDLNADLSSVVPSPLLRSFGKVYQVSLRYTRPLPKWGKLDQVVALGYDFKYANTPLEFDEEALSSFRAAIDQFVASYHARLPDALGYNELSASVFYSPGSLLGPNTTADFRTLAPSNAPDLSANYNYAHVNGERGFSLPWKSLLKLEAGAQAASGRLLPSEQMYLGGDQLLRGYPENVVAGDEGWNATAELHTPIIRTGNITRQQYLPGVDGDTLEVFGFYDYGSVRPSGSDAGTYRYNLDSAGAGLNLHISQNLVVNFAYGFELKPLRVSTGSISSAQASGRSRALISVTLSY